jgi:Transposase domain (DUF772)
MVRMLRVGYCYGIRSERRLCEEVYINLVYRWFCRLRLEMGSFGQSRSAALTPLAPAALGAAEAASSTTGALVVSQPSVSAKLYSGKGPPGLLVLSAEKSALP